MKNDTCGLGYNVWSPQWDAVELPHQRDNAHTETCTRTAQRDSNTPQVRWVGKSLSTLGLRVS